MGLDMMSVEEALAVMHAEDLRAVEAVGTVRADVARAVELVVAAIGSGGRLFYVGAGTSGRLGVLDASECPPTFRTDPEMVQGVIAGGQEAMFRAKEGAEDSSEGGANMMDEKEVGARDVVMGIAAGGTTPFVHGALRRARERGAKTVFLSCVERVEGEAEVDVAIRPLTGPEVVTGSTRLKAGTATKLVLNQISTVAMVRLGKVYENLMVDVKATNAKLRDRAARMVGTLTGVGREEAIELLEEAGGWVKVAVVMKWRGVGREEAEGVLAGVGGRLAEVGRMK